MRYTHATLLALVMALTVRGQQFSGYDHYVYDPNDFAVAWFDYQPVGMGYDWLTWPRLGMNDPDTVLGRPTIDTTGDDMYIPEDDPAPVNPVYPAFRYYELLWLGEAGHVSVAFDHPVRDDRNNPYGIDLIVYGNAFQEIGANQGWENGNPAGTTVGPDGFYEPGIVSVSQDSIIWYSFTNDPGFMPGDPCFVLMDGGTGDGPFCDAFAPTLGRVYDPCNPDPNVGAWNQWWAQPTNPTFPVDPELWFSDFDGFSVAEICQTYGPSSGGTGYDLDRLALPVDPCTGCKWCLYVRVDDQPAGGSAELDAFADVSCCGDWKHPYPVGDITQDCKVNLHDFGMLAAFWLAEVTVPDDPAAMADLDDNDTIGMSDLTVLAEHWLHCTWDCH